jgi:hypothetical protein
VVTGPVSVLPGTCMLDEEERLKVQTLVADAISSGWN